MSVQCESSRCRERVHGVVACRRDGSASGACAADVADDDDAGSARSGSAQCRIVFACVSATTATRVCGSIACVQAIACTIASTACAASSSGQRRSALVSVSATTATCIRHAAASDGVCGTLTASTCTLHASRSCAAATAAAPNSVWCASRYNALRSTKSLRRSRERHVSTATGIATTAAS
jgi:hypothetical protein